MNDDDVLLMVSCLYKAPIRQARVVNFLVYVLVPLYFQEFQKPLLLSLV